MNFMSLSQCELKVIPQTACGGLNIHTCFCIVTSKEAIRNVIKNFVFQDIDTCVNCYTLHILEIIFSHNFCCKTVTCN